MMLSVPATSNRMAAKTALPAPLILALLSIAGHHRNGRSDDASFPRSTSPGSVLPRAGAPPLRLGVRRAPDELAPARPALREPLLGAGALGVGIAPVGPRRPRLGQA